MRTLKIPRRLKIAKNGPIQPLTTLAKFSSRNNYSFTHKHIKGEKKLPHIQTPCRSYGIRASLREFLLGGRLECWFYPRREYWSGLEISVDLLWGWGGGWKGWWWRRLNKHEFLKTITQRPNKGVEPGTCIQVKEFTPAIH